MYMYIIILQIVLYVLSGHAYHGDLDAIKTTIGIMREQRLFAGHNVFAEMLDALSRGGHHEKIVEVININYIIIVYMYVYMYILPLNSGYLHVHVCRIHFGEVVHNYMYISYHCSLLSTSKTSLCKITGVVGSKGSVHHDIH